jgi:hypothetical protein
MMGTQKIEPQFFNYAVNLEKRVRANHPLRQVKALIDFSFVREEVAHCYGRNGNESVPPEVILKMMFLLFFDDVKSERELMEVIGSGSIICGFWIMGWMTRCPIIACSPKRGRAGARKYLRVCLCARCATACKRDW